MKTIFFSIPTSRDLNSYSKDPLPSNHPAHHPTRATTPPGAESTLRATLFCLPPHLFQLPNLSVSVADTDSLPSRCFPRQGSNPGFSRFESYFVPLSYYDSSIKPALTKGKVAYSFCPFVPAASGELLRHRAAALLRKFALGSVSIAETSNGWSNFEGQSPFQNETDARIPFYHIERFDKSLDQDLDRSRPDQDLLPAGCYLTAVVIKATVNISLQKNTFGKTLTKTICYRCYPDAPCSKQRHGVLDHKDQAFNYTILINAYSMAILAASSNKLI